MGGNTYNRQSLSDNELMILVDECIKDPLKSIFSNRVFDSSLKWRANVSRYLDKDSSNRFYFFLAEKNKEVPNCAFCKDILTIQAFNYAIGFSKYCTACTLSKVWKTIECIGNEKLAARNLKIASKLSIFYSSEEGISSSKKRGQENSVKLKAFHKTEEGRINREKSKEHNKKWMHDNILSGKFTPNSNNRNTHWETSYKAKKYRSSWEAIYQYLYPDDLHEKLRISYQYKGVNYIYIVDFINYNTNIVTEVKPKELCSDPKFIVKFKALSEWAANNGFIARIADLEFIKNHQIPTNLQEFDTNTQRKIRKIYGISEN